MRAHIKLSAKNQNEIILPIHHNHILQGFIYNSFVDETFTDFLHEEGYKWKKRKFKLFTFSRLNGEMEIKHDKEIMIFQSPVTLTISSIKKRIIEELVSNMIKSEKLRLGSQQVFLEEINMENYNFKADTDYIINFLSPVTVYETEVVNGDKRTHYFKPWENEFKKQIVNNLKKKYEIIEGQEIKDPEFDIKPQFDKKDKDPNVILFRGFVIKGWTGPFKIIGNPDLMKIGYNCGLGAKNSMGHGCFEVIKELEGGEKNDRSAKTTR